MLGYAPITALVAWWSTTEEYRSLHRNRVSPTGAAAVDLARAEIRRGAGEFGGNNRGPDVDKYRGKEGAGRKGSWCASFQYWLESTVRTVAGLKMPFGYTPGARKLYRLTAQHGMLVDADDIHVGDLVLWARGPRGSWKAHIGRVSHVVRDEKRLGKVLKWKYIAGNEGRFPARVREGWGHKRKRLIGFARL